MVVTPVDMCKIDLTTYINNNYASTEKLGESSVMHILTRKPNRRRAVVRLSTVYPHVIPATGSRGQTTLLSRMALVIFCRLVSRVASVLSRAATRWQACITVVWSRPPNSMPTSVVENLVSERARNIAT